MSWARLFRRMFDIDMHNCPDRGAGEFKVIASIPKQPVIEKILAHLGVQGRAPPRAPAWRQTLHAA